MSFLSLEKLAIRKGRAVLYLTWPESESIDVDSDFMDQIKRRYPTITRHSCINAQGPTFEDIAYSTNVAHVLEHVIIEEQLERMLPAKESNCLSQKKASGKQPAENRSARVSFGHDLSCIYDPAIILKGTTKLFRDKRLAIVEISFADDIIAVQSILSALNCVNSLYKNNSSNI